MLIMSPCSQWVLIIHHTVCWRVAGSLTPKAPRFHSCSISDLSKGFGCIGLVPFSLTLQKLLGCLKLLSRWSKLCVTDDAVRLVEIFCEVTVNAAVKR